MHVMACSGLRSDGMVCGNILIRRFMEKIRETSPKETVVGERTGGQTIKE